MKLPDLDEPRRALMTAALEVLRGESSSDLSIAILLESGERVLVDATVLPPLNYQPSRPVLRPSRGRDEATSYVHRGIMISPRSSC